MDSFTIIEYENGKKELAKIVRSTKDILAIMDKQNKIIIKNT